jgi:hypothetical protein
MITDDFEAIASDDQVQSFIDKYGLKPCQVGTDAVHLGFRWYDPSGPFNMQPDMHVVKLTVKGQGKKAVYQKELKYPDKI